MRYGSVNAENLTGGYPAPFAPIDPVLAAFSTDCRTIHYCILVSLGEFRSRIASEKCVGRF
jgi:hypothetical protein